VELFVPMIHIWLSEVGFFLLCESFTGSIIADMLLLFRLTSAPFFFFFFFFFCVKKKNIDASPHS
jgi:hypothetical protein